MAMIEFFVDGEPRAKQSFVSTGRGTGYTPARVKAWQADVGWIAKQKMHEVGFVGPIVSKLSVTLIFHLGDCRRIDLDNLSKGTLDGMQGIVFENDDQVMLLHLRKIQKSETPGVRVQVQLLTEDTSCN